MLKGAVPFGRIAGIRIYVHWSLLATLALLTSLLAVSILPGQFGGGPALQYWSAGGATAALFLLSLAAHEVAHSVVARRNGVAVERITLWLLGGMSELHEDPPDPRSDFRIAVVGPAISLLIGIIALAVAAAVEPVTSPVITAAVVWLGSANLILAVFNMLPAAPLDGGRVLRSFLWRRSGDRLAATASAARSGRALGLILIVLGAAEAILLGSAGGLWLMLLGWFLRGAANAELLNASTTQQLGDVRVADAMTRAPVVAYADSTIDDFLTGAVSAVHHRIFPVVDAQAHPVGVVSLADLSRTPQTVRARTTIGSIARALPPSAVVRGDELLAASVSRAILRPGLDLLAVVDGQRLTGIVTATDLLRVCDRTALGLPVTGHKANG